MSYKSSRSTNPSFYIENLGCAKNQVDAEVMTTALENRGWTWEEDPDRSDLIIINTCGFIQSAKEESIESFLLLKEKYPDKKMIVAGCLAERYGTELEGRLDGLDGIFGNKAPEAISDFAARIIEGEHGIEMPVPTGTTLRRNRFFSYPGSAFIKIGEGCDNRCTYCSIPLIRGGLVSRPVEEIVDEVALLVKKGLKEFNLVAQDLGSYGKDRGEGGIETLLRGLMKIRGDFWVRMLYIHPDHFPEGIVDCCRDDVRILPYFDIPFQHSSGSLLQRMGRKGNGEIYSELVKSIRTALPDAVLRSTFMTGFPGETEADFEDLLRFQGAVQLDWLGVFTYSREEDTPAYDMTGPVRYRRGRKQAKRYKQQLEERQIPITAARLDRYIGRELTILIEEAVEGESLLIGRGYLQAPDVDGLMVVRSRDPENPPAVGTTITGKIIKRNGVDLEALEL